MIKIIITGFMGSGKSTVGRALARQLNCPLIDLDQTIEREEGRSARQIIEEDGEPRFRDLENQMLAKVLADSTVQVVALGGGAWISEKNRQLIRDQGGVSVWLDAPFDLCWKRIAASGAGRPLARSEADAGILFAERRPSYELAEVHIETTWHNSVDEIATEIIQALAHRKD